jgi:putative inorganic carbon (hco3(-)) transporter
MNMQPEGAVDTGSHISRCSAISGFLRHWSALVIKYEVWIIALLVAATMVSARLLPVAVVMALLFWPLRRIGTGSFTIRTPLDALIGLLLLVLPVTWMISVFPEKTVPQVLRLLTGIALFYAIINWAITKGRLKLLAIGIVLIGLALALMSPVSVTWVADNKLSFLPSSFYQRFTVLVSDSVHPNVMGGNLVLFIPISMAYLFFSWGKLTFLERAFLIVSGFLMMGVIVLTKSRGAWLALAVSTSLVVLLRWRYRWLLISLSPIVILLLIIFNNPSFSPIPVTDALGGVEGRLEIASRAIYMIRDFPFTGIGMGSFENIADLLYPFFMFPPGKIVHAHNLFLQIAVDLGIPGFIAWLSVYLLVIYCSIKVFQFGILKNNTFFAGLGAGLLGSQLALTIHGLTDAVTWGMVRPAPLVWVLWGLAVALTNYLYLKST